MHLYTIYSHRLVMLNYLASGSLKIPQNAESNKEIPVTSVLSVVLIRVLVSNVWAYSEFVSSLISVHVTTVLSIAALATYLLTYLLTY